MNDKEEYIKYLNDAYYDPYIFFTKYCVIQDKYQKNVPIKISRKQYDRFIKLTNRKNSESSTTFAF